MLLKEIRLKNFRQYKGEQVVKFSNDSTKNVTLLLGENTSGKTTFIQAFRWALYGDADFTGRGQTDVLNDDVVRSTRAGEVAEASVTLLLEHHHEEYEIFRSAIYKPRESAAKCKPEISRLIYYITPDGERRIVSEDFDNKVNEILPRELSEYFFFDGEKIANSRKYNNVEKSINTIMGLSPLKYMMEHLNGRGHSVLKSLEDQLVDDGSGELTSLKRHQESKKRELDDIEEMLSSIDKKIEIAQNYCDDCYEKFIRIKDSVEYEKELNKVEAELERAKQNVNTAKTSVMSSFAPMMIEQYLSYLSKVIKYDLSAEKFEDKGIPGINAEALLFLMKRGKCICGSDLTEGCDCYNNLKELINYLPPESIGTQIKNLNNRLNDRAGVSSAYKLFDVNYNTYLNSTERQDELIRRQTDLYAKVDGKQGGEEIKRKYLSAKDQLENVTKSKEANISNRGVVSAELDKIEMDIKAASRRSDVNADVDAKIAYAKALYSQANKIYVQKSEEILKVMRETLTDVFNSMYHGRRTIQLSNDYRVTLSVNGAQLDASKGLETVANFAFISSLLKIAKDRINPDASGIESEPYPLAMDAVFSNTDDVHIVNICKQLPDLAEQAILALMDKEWEFAKSTLTERVGRVYRLKKHSESYTEIVEVSL